MEEIPVHKKRTINQKLFIICAILFLILVVIDT